MMVGRQDVLASNDRIRGAFVFAIAIRMAGAIREHEERTEALLAEQATQARRSGHITAPVVDNAAEGIPTVWLNGRIGSFNAATEKLFGWSATEIVGQPVTTILPSDLDEQITELLASCWMNGHSAMQRRDAEVTADPT